MTDSLVAGANLMSAWSQLFTEHPTTVNETYFQHLANATSFGLRMIGGGLVCVVHGLLPGVFCTKASDTICELHESMVTNRRRLAERPLGAGQPRAA